MRSHSLIHQQKIGVVSRSGFAVYPVAYVTLVANASKLIVAGRHARCVRRTEIRVVSARGMRKTRETISVVTLGGHQNYIVNYARESQRAFNYQNNHIFPT